MVRNVPKVKSNSVELSGDLTIRSIAEFHGRLHSALQSCDHVDAEIADDAEVDLTLIQLIESARRSASEAGKTFALARPPSGQLLETLRRGGFLSDPAQQAFWLSGSGIQ